ncbi:hypothetical protein [Aporhodopirellula aestuarii]|uniref:DUF5666 domain-containing protein n=1 Tax=Aporhodopirellula aestuarii TaxID=2950107 RepID=A0ABT0U766_9BACT|nr:hypothetical protein [Aporhodopirellula aestuarii]MCM2372793.1 hypothetical protein [Aporhodopirellula aestuarii]
MTDRILSRGVFILGPTQQTAVTRRMPRRALLTGCTLLCLVMICGSATTSAAPPDGSGFGGGGTGALANEVTVFDGTLKDARGNIITVTREDGTECTVQFPDEITSLEFVGKALPAYLRRGTPIRFATVLGPTGMPMAPVNQLQIFAPLSPQLVPHNQAERFTPGVHSADKKKPQRGMPLTGKVIVVGNLMMLTAQGGLAVQAGSTPVQTMVSPDATLEIRVNNLSLAQPGDAVSVEGFYQPPDETKVKANKITITTDRVFGEMPAKPTRQRPTKKSKVVEPTVEPEKMPGEESVEAEAEEKDAAADAED